MSRDDARDTVERLLDAAEKLFGERGVDQSPLRDITREADANIAAVNYHFGSKEGLLQATYRRRMEPLNEERLRLLDEAEAARGGPALEDILRSFLQPTVRLWRDHSATMRFIGRMHADPDECRLESFLRHARFPELIRRLRHALMMALPGSRAADLWWGMIFTVGAMVHTWAMGEKMSEFSRGEVELEGEDRMVNRLVTFCAAGMRARLGPGEDR